MAGQFHRDDGPRPGSEAESRAARPPDRSDRALFGALCTDLERWFPDRFDRSVIEDIVTGVLIAWRDSPAAALREVTATHSGRMLLRAAIKREAVDRLARDPALLRLIDAGRAAGDDDFARALFGDSSTASTVIRIMKLLVRTGHVDDFRIVTQYLDMAYLDGVAPTHAAVAYRLSLPVPTVRAALDHFRRLLAEQPATGR